MFPEGRKTRKHCFLAMFPEGRQTRKHCFLLMFPEGGQTRKHCFIAMFAKRWETKEIIHAISLLLGLCISDPQMCDEGMAMAIKLKFNDEAKNYTDEPRFILDSGAHDPQSRGFSLHLQNGKLYCVVSISNGEWKVGGDYRHKMMNCMLCHR